jgi:hypothetical protein
MIERIGEWLTTIAESLWALTWRCFIVGGSALILFSQTIYAFFAHGNELPISPERGLVACFAVASVWALIDKAREAHYRNAREILKEIVDNLTERRYESGILIEESGRELIHSLILASDSFKREQDVVWVCRQFPNADPFKTFELRYGENSFKGKRLKFLRNARVRAPIRCMKDAIHYIDHHWAKPNGLNVPDPTSEAAMLTARVAFGIR